MIIKFKFQNNDKQIVTETQTFENTRDFYSYLRKNKFTLINYKIIKKKFQVSSNDILLFTENFRNLLESGITITIALEILSEQEKNKDFSNIILKIRNSILSGCNLYTSFLEFNHIFGNGYLNLLAIGEETGSLTENLEKICENLILEKKIKSKIKEALFYPIIVLCFTILLILFMLIYVFPNFLQLFQNSNIELPFFTKILLNLSKNSFFIIFLLFFSISLITIFSKYISQKTKEKIKLKLPLVKKIILKKSIIYFSNNFYITIDAGIGIISALELIKETSPYFFIQQITTKIQIQIKNGKSIFDAFSNTSLFSPTQLKLIGIGEKTGTLPKAFKNIALTTQKDLEREIFHLIIFLEPILLLFLGIIIALLIIAIYIPIFNITDTII